MKPIKKSLFFPANTQLPCLFPSWEYHVHSTYSDGTSHLAVLIDKARQLGINRLIFTEHTEPDLVHSLDWFSNYFQEVDQLRARETSDMDIIIGLEVPITDFKGGLLWDEEMRQKAEFVLGAVHAYPGYDWNISGMPADQSIELEYQGLMALAENPLIDAIAHPGGVCHKYCTPFPLSLFEEVVKKATQNSIAIELNPTYQNPIKPYLEICRRNNALISPGSNAHHLYEIGLAWKTLSGLMESDSLINAECIKNI